MSIQLLYRIKALEVKIIEQEKRIIQLEANLLELNQAREPMVIRKPRGRPRGQTRDT